MSVTIDQESLETERLGFNTVGQVLAHVQRENRLVTNLLIDGREPDLDRMGLVRQSPVLGHTIYIETAEPREMAIQVLGEIESQLEEADRLRSSAIDLLYRNQPNRAMEKLSGCFSTWHIAQESVLKTAQLLRIDLERMQVGGEPLFRVLNAFAEQLRQIRTALEQRDFVTLIDVLTYEATQTSERWGEVLDSMRQAVAVS